jgi:hypothetical protein
MPFSLLTGVRIFPGAEFRYLWAKATFSWLDTKPDGYATTLSLGFRF